MYKTVATQSPRRGQRNQTGGLPCVRPRTARVNAHVGISVKTYCCSSSVHPETSTKSTGLHRPQDLTQRASGLDRAQSWFV